MTGNKAIENTEFDEGYVQGIDDVKLSKSNIESLGFKLRNKFSIDESYRFTKETEWLEDLRVINGVYDPDVLKKIGTNRSKVYPKIVRAKKKPLESKLHEISFPDIGKAWGVEPTPEPELPDEIVGEIYQSLYAEETARWENELAQYQQKGEQPPVGFPSEPPKPALDKVRAAITKKAKERCALMESEIADQFIDTKYNNKMKKAQDSGLTLGTGVVKGPLVKYTEVKKYTSENGIYRMTKRKKPIPHLEFVRLWDFYPDMTVSEIDQCEGFFERHIMTKHEVRKLAERGDFKPWEGVINKYLEINPDGDSDFKHWELALQQIDSKGESAVKKGRKYEVLEYWGWIDSRDMEECGVTLDDKQKDIELQANVWLLGDKVIKAVLNGTPKEEQPYHVFYLEKDDTSIFGKGLPRIMRDTQIAICAAARMILDNGAITSGPQLEINIDLIDPEQDLESIYPFKVWPREGKNQEATAPALRVYNIESHIDEYLKIIDLWLRFGDLETAFPTNMLIEPTKSGNETAQGASIRFSTVNVTVKDIAKNFDDFTSDIVEGFYTWNMEFNEREEIKGDYKVHAKGLSSLVAKEVRAQQLQNAHANIIPLYKDWIKDRQMLIETWKAHDLPIDVVRTEEEHKLYVEEHTDPRAMELQLATLEAELKEIKAKTLAYLSKAKKANVDAIKQATATETPRENVK